MISGGESGWVDHHCHLDEHYVETIAHAKECGVSKLIDIGCDVEGAVRSLTRASEIDGLVATAGIHPHQAAQTTEGLEALLGHESLVAVGECGLDYHYDHAPRDVQQRVFAEQIDMANRYDLPLVIHTREAWDDTFAILDEVGVPNKVIFHCFTGGVAELKMCIERDAYISFSGIVTFKNATDIHEAARDCPKDRFLVETDSPYLAPVPYRGKQNRPGYVAFVGAELAQLRSTPVEEIARQAWCNTHNAYPKLTDATLI